MHRDLKLADSPSIAIHLQLYDSWEKRYFRILSVFVYLRTEVETGKLSILFEISLVIGEQKKGNRMMEGTTVNNVQIEYIYFFIARIPISQ